LPECPAGSRNNAVDHVCVSDGSRLAGAAQAQLALYENDNFSVRVYRTTNTVQNLDDVGFNDRASSVVVRNGWWQVCSDANFRGQCVTLDPGEYPTLRSMGLNDKLSSVRDLDLGQGGWSGGGWSSARITLYENDDFKGQSVPASGNLADLAKSDSTTRRRRPGFAMGSGSCARMPTIAATASRWGLASIGRFALLA
jgi:hypothetical protein